MIRDVRTSFRDRDQLIKNQKCGTRSPPLSLSESARRISIRRRRKAGRGKRTLSRIICRISPESRPELLLIRRLARMRVRLSRRIPRARGTADGRSQSGKYGENRE
jgi:hypothetical protein